jgi:hypothetical protein
MKWINHRMRRNWDKLRNWFEEAVEKQSTLSKDPDVMQRNWHKLRIWVEGV